MLICCGARFMSNMRQIILKSVKNLSVWEHAGTRAPHKPLLILLGLARITQGYDRLATFGDLEKLLRHLLQSYGPPRKSVHPEYPFWWLQSDKLWEVPNSSSLIRRLGGNSPLKSELLKKNVMGGFPENIYHAFNRDRRFVDRIARMLLDAHFPESLHEDILADIGLYLSSRSHKRDSQFRLNVIRAYEHRCAICGYDLKIGYSDLALEAAHIKWHQAGGPDEVQNGLALCAIHHKALDRGAIGLTDNLTVLISSDIHGQSWMLEWFGSFIGKRISSPSRSEWTPKPEHIQWHANQVFRWPAKD